MRQGVKKPPASAKRRIRVQGRVDGHTQPIVVTHHSPAPRHATKAHTGRLINHFSPSLFIVTESALSAAAKRPPASDIVKAPAAPRQHTTAELLEYAVQYADVPQAMDWPVSRKQHRRPRSAKRRHAHVIGAHA
jgi:hypothetical protein